MSNHQFNPFIAEKYGVIEAIFIDQFIFWTKTNAAKNENYHEYRFWSYGTPVFFTSYFTYLSPSQIKYALKNLVKSGALIKGNFNKKGYDKTNWYSLSDSLLCELNLDKTCLKPAPGLIEQNCSMDRTKLADGSDKIVQPIPSTKPSTKPSIKTLDPLSKKENPFTLEEMLKDNPHYLDSEMLEDWIEVRRKKKSPLTRTSWQRTNSNLAQIEARFGISPYDVLAKTVDNHWKSIEVHYFKPREQVSKKSGLTAEQVIGWAQS